MSHQCSPFLSRCSDSRRFAKAGEGGYSQWQMGHRTPSTATCHGTGTMVTGIRPVDGRIRNAGR